MLQTGFGFGCESPEPQPVTTLSIYLVLLTRPSFCFFHCVLKYDSFYLMVLFFITFCLHYILSPGNWATFSDKSRRYCSNSKFIWVPSVCPFVAVEVVSIFAVFRSDCEGVAFMEVDTKRNRNKK